MLEGSLHFRHGMRNVSRSFTAPSRNPLMENPYGEPLPQL